MKKDNWKCKVCCEDEKTLNVHHIRYEKGKKIWQYNDCYLITLCEDCHNEWHRVYDKGLGWGRISAIVDVCDTYQIGIEHFKAIKLMNNG